MTDKRYFVKVAPYKWQQVPTVPPDVIEHVCVDLAGNGFYNKANWIDRDGTFFKQTMYEHYFNTYILPFANLLTTEETDMDPKNYYNESIKEEYLKDDLTSDGMTRQQLEKIIHDIAHQEVLKAIAQHERTKIEISDYEFEVKDRVFKFKGDYKLEGTVVGRFKMLNNSVRYVIEHEAVGGGSFCHIYSPSQLQKI